MKKLFYLSLCAVIAIYSLSGCGAKEEMVEVNIPSSLFMGEEITDEQLQQNMEENGYASYKLNEDGSVTYTMTKTKHQEILNEYKKTVDDTISNYLTGEDAVESFSNIEYDEGMTEFDIYVDSESYSLLDSINALTFYILGGYYQTFAGVSSNEINIIVNFIDQDTNETLDTSSYNDFINNTAYLENSLDSGMTEFEESIDTPDSSESMEESSEIPMDNISDKESGALDELNLSIMADMLDSNINDLKAKYPNASFEYNEIAFILKTTYMDVQANTIILCNDSDNIIAVIAMLSENDLSSQQIAQNYAKIHNTIVLSYGDPTYTSYDPAATSGAAGYEAVYNNAEELLEQWEFDDLYVEQYLIPEETTTHLIGLMTPEGKEVASQ